MKKILLLSLILSLTASLNGQGIGVFDSAPFCEETTVGATPKPQKEEKVAQNEVTPQQPKKKTNPMRTPAKETFKPAPKAPAPVCAAPCPAPCEPVCYEPCDPPKVRQRGLMWAPIALVAGGVAAACVSAIHSGQDDVGPSDPEPTPPPPPTPDNLQFNVILDSFIEVPVNVTITLEGPSGVIDVRNVTFDSQGDSFLIPLSPINDPEAGTYTITISPGDGPVLDYTGEMLVNGIVVDTEPSVNGETESLITFTYPVP